jgi:hypothetical protein
MEDNTTPGNRKVALPFASEFWSAFYTGLSEPQSDGAKNDGGSCELSRRRQEREVKAALKGITVVQELFATPEHNFGLRQRAAMLLWEFTIADTNKPGKVVSKGIVLPWSDNITTSPITPSFFPRSAQEFENISGISTEFPSPWDEQPPLSSYENLGLSQSSEMAECYSFKPHAFSTSQISLEPDTSISYPLVGNMDMTCHPIQHEDSYETFSHLSTMMGNYIPSSPYLEHFLQDNVNGCQW